MPPYKNEERVVLSVLDRLIDDKPRDHQEPHLNLIKNVRYYKETMRRDLEWLLNTRRVALRIPAELKELNNSLAVYGRPCFSHACLQNTGEQEWLRQAVENAIRQFEPRLRNVAVNIQAVASTDQSIRFSISARLLLDTIPIPVEFDTAVNLKTREFFLRVS